MPNAADSMNRNPPRTDHAVLIAGAGPTGMMLAAELQLAGVDVAIVERRAAPDLAGSRGGGMYARTIELFDQRGVAERFVAEGTKHSAVHFHLTPLNVSDLPTRHPYVLALWQNHIERIMAEWLAELGVVIYRERDVTTFVQDDSGVDLAFSDGRTMRAEYLVGCDGGRSVVRKTAAIEFPGFDATTSWLIAEVQTAVEPAWGFRQDAAGIHGIGKVDEHSGRARVVITERELASDHDAPPTLRDVSDALVAVFGNDFGAHGPTWISRFTDLTRQAAAYRDGRVLLAGDAAHVHPPIGGQGLNLGVQDAVNLGWKLAQVVKRISPASLLDTYHAERHPVGARVLRNTMAQVALRRTDERSKALGEVVAEMVTLDEARKRWAAEICGLGVRYDLGEGHALLGRRIPDLDLDTADGARRVFALLHDAQPVLMNLGEPGRFDAAIAPWNDRVRLVDATAAAEWELPALGTLPAPGAVLVRPDGYVAWTGDATGLPLADALAKWFGPARERVEERDR